MLVAPKSRNMEFLTIWHRNRNLLGGYVTGFEIILLCSAAAILAGGFVPPAVIDRSLEKGNSATIYSGVPAPYLISALKLYMSEVFIFKLPGDCHFLQLHLPRPNSGPSRNLHSHIHVTPPESSNRFSGNVQGFTHHFYLIRYRSPNKILPVQRVSNF